MSEPTSPSRLSRYQIFAVTLLVLLLFLIVVDYMLLPALSAILLPALSLSTEQFAGIASAYAFSAAISSFLATGYLDRFDRKKILTVFYAGFVSGLILCGFANSYLYLLIARVFTGFFGGVVGSIVFSMVGDIFASNQRGKVMGFIQMSYAAGQIGGLPLAIFIATHFTWNIPYWIFGAFGVVLLSLLFFFIKPINNHLIQTENKNPFQSLFGVIKTSRYWFVFVNNTLIVLCDVMLMTFDSAYINNNLEIPIEKLATVYGVIGITTFFSGPIFGKLSDQFGKFLIFASATTVSIGIILFYTNLTPVPFWAILVIHAIIFMGSNARMVSSTSLGIGVPGADDRGSFMAFDSSLEQLAGGIAAGVAGLIVYQGVDEMMMNYRWLGICIAVLMGASIFMMKKIDQLSTS